MDLQVTEVRNDCAGEGQQQFDRRTVTQGSPEAIRRRQYDGTQPLAEECPPLETAAKKRDRGH
jgi:hypothetical protein